MKKKNMPISDIAEIAELTSAFVIIAVLRLKLCLAVLEKPGVAPSHLGSLPSLTEILSRVGYFKILGITYCKLGILYYYYVDFLCADNIG